MSKTLFEAVQEAHAAASQLYHAAVDPWLIPLVEWLVKQLEKLLS